MKRRDKLPVAVPSAAPLAPRLRCPTASRPLDRNCISPIKRAIRRCLAKGAMVPPLAALIAIGCGENASQFETVPLPRPPGDGSTSTTAPTTDATPSVVHRPDVGADAGPTPPPYCPAGEPACPCYPNGTCNPVDGIAQACRAGICGPPNDNPAGDLGQSCAYDADCRPYHDTPLACLSGRCTAPGCASGTPGCPCIAGTTCNGDAQCVEGFCAAATCQTGALGCPCNAGACDAPLRCTSGTCRDEARVALTLLTPQARACEGRVELSVDAVPAVQFDAALRGQQLQRGPALGFSFVTVADAPATGAQVTLIFSGAAHAGDAALTTSRCYDRLGNLIPGAGLRLERR